MNYQELLKYMSQKEIDAGLYDYKIKDLSIYSVLRYHIRKEILKKNGAATMDAKQKLNSNSVFVSTIVGFVHIIKLSVCRKHYSTVFYSFPRVDHMGGVYIDKFTDPLIELVDFKNDYIILDHGRAGVHLEPRLHHNNIIYLDFISVFSRVYAAICWKFYSIRYKSEFENLSVSVNHLFSINLSANFLAKQFLTRFTYIGLLERIFKLISAKRVIGPARAFLSAPFCAAHRLRLKTFELQHGITYGETQMYSGFRDEMIMPDYFLAFGDNKPLDVYGIDTNRIINIGWALNDYILNLPKQEYYNPNDVLVISDPEITDKIFHATKILADNNRDSVFYFRPHPHENLSKEHLEIIERTENLKLQDKRVNISIVLQGFNHIIGENSTVLYEALSVRKKVGRLFFEGLNPKYLEESDRRCFWEIRNDLDFKTFLSEDISSKESKSIYSKFNKELFVKTIGV